MVTNSINYWISGNSHVFQTLPYTEHLTIVTLVAAGYKHCTLVQATSCVTVGPNLGSSYKLCDNWTLPRYKLRAVWQLNLTLVQATSCEVARAQLVAELMTLFCRPWSSVVLATFLAFSTSWAVALATALARANRVSYNNQIAGLINMLYRKVYHHVIYHISKQFKQARIQIWHYQQGFIWKLLKINICLIQWVTIFNIET